MIRWINADLTLGDKQIFINKDLYVSPMSKLLLRDKSGSGKTTLLKTALGLVQLDSGEIHINGKQVTASNIDRIRADIFYIDQDVTLPELQVELLINEIFSYKANKDKYYSTEDLTELLDLFQLKNKILNNNIRELSGGERQRIALIIGLLLKKPIWFLDEPTSAMDSELRKIVVDKILLQSITAIVVSHDSCWNILCQ